MALEVRESQVAARLNLLQMTTVRAGLPLPAAHREPHGVGVAKRGLCAILISALFRKEMEGLYYKLFGDILIKLFYRHTPSHLIYKEFRLANLNNFHKHS